MTFGSTGFSRVLFLIVRLVVVLFAFFFIIFFVFGFFILVVFVFGKDNQVDRMSLRYFEFRVAFWAGKNLALFYFVLVQVDFRIALRTLRHVTFLPAGVCLKPYYIP